jgi:ubiquinone/menaquinone biosynthesis C-methylase UbiE
VGEVHDPHLPEGSCDLVLLVDVYHEFSHPEVMLKAIRKALKTDGKVVLVEFRAEDLTVPIKPEHKMSKAQIMKELEANGFALKRSFDELPWQHMLWFGKSE